MAHTDLTTVADIQSFFLNITFSDLTRPTLVTVGKWIGEATSLMYSTLSRQYILPITDTDDLVCLKLIAEDYVLENVNYTLGRSRISVDGHGVQQAKVIKHASFYERLEKLRLNTPSSTNYSSYNLYLEDEVALNESDKSKVKW